MRPRSGLWCAAVAALALTASAAACSGTPEPRAPVAPSRPATPPTFSTTSGAPTGPSEGATNPHWVPGNGEVQPEVKLAAVRALEGAGTWRRSQGTPPAIASRLAGQEVMTGAARRIMAATAATAEESSLVVLYPQYGGITEARASVLVVARQILLTNGATTTRDYTIDVRLAKRGTRWEVIDAQMASTTAATRLSVLAKAVLSNPSVRLPAAARADIRSGQVDDTILAVLDAVGRQYVVDVTVLKSGHPRNVFGTDRRSNHSRGSAVDIWRINDLLVVDPGTPRDVLAGVMKEAARAGATEIGGPFVPPGSGRSFYTDVVHADHLHFGVDQPTTPPNGS